MWDPQLDHPSSSPTHSRRPQDNKKDHVEDDSQIDSGFLSSEQILHSFGHDNDHPHQSPTHNAKDTKDPATAKSLAGESSSSTYLDSGLVEDFPSVASGVGEAAEMLLEKDVDTGLAEWLCHSLNLKKPATGPCSESSPINNLSSRKVDNGSSLSPDVEKKNISDHPATTAAPAPTFDMPEEEQPWERCYLQDADGETYLHLAVYDGAEDIVRSLIQITPHPCLLDIQNDLLQSALHLAVISGNARIVRMLLLAGAESSIRDKYGNTPLHLACAAGDLDAVRALTERITASEEATAASCTGVLTAADNGEPAQRLTINRPQLVQYADVELRNYDGERCVHIAATVAPKKGQKHVALMRQLVVRSGADVNAREGKAGYTPLHLAVERNDLELVKCLLHECPSVNLEAMSYGRWTPYQIAIVNRNTDIMSLLEDKGAMALGVSSDNDSEDDDSDLEDEILQMLNAASNSGKLSFGSDRTVPCVGY